MVIEKNIIIAIIRLIRFERIFTSTLGLVILFNSNCKSDLCRNAYI